MRFGRPYGRWGAHPWRPGRRWPGRADWGWGAAPWLAAVEYATPTLAVAEEAPAPAPGTFAGAAVLLAVGLAVGALLGSR